MFKSFSVSSGSFDFKVSSVNSSFWLIGGSVWHILAKNLLLLVKFLLSLRFSGPLEFCPANWTLVFLFGGPVVTLLVDCFLAPSINYFLVVNFWASFAGFFKSLVDPSFFKLFYFYLIFFNHFFFGSWILGCDFFWTKSLSLGHLGLW